MNVQAVRALLLAAKREADEAGVEVGDVLLSILLVHLAEEDAEASRPADPVPVWIAGGVGDGE